jgi:hypothetical protein
MGEPSKWLGPNHRIVRHDLAYALRMVVEIPRQTRKREGKITTPLDLT